MMRELRRNKLWNYDVLEFVLQFLGCSSIRDFSAIRGEKCVASSQISNPSLPLTPRKTTPATPRRYMNYYAQPIARIGIFIARIS
jgi:hypothetical protein